MNPLVFNKIWRTVWSFLKNLGIKLSYDPGTPLLGIYPEETRIEKDTCTPIFIAALLTIATMWKQPIDRKVVVHTHSGILPRCCSYLKTIALTKQILCTKRNKSA